jgi:hypothetical protein
MSTISALTAPDRGASASLREQICQAVVAAGDRHFAGRLQTVVLTGSMARDEATFQSRGSGLEVLGDAEFVLVFHDLPNRAELEQFILDAQKMCAAEQIACKIDCSAVRPGYFRKLRPTIYSYELLTCGRVCGGDGLAFVKAPRFQAAEIPREDGWRMLCNRLVELLEVFSEKGACSLGPAADYRAVKLNLDLATSILLFAGLYQPGYEERSRIFQKHYPELSERVGINLAPFAADLDQCTQAKLGRAPIPRFEHSQSQAVLQRALEVCSWELRQMLGKAIAAEDPEKLMEMWIDRQSMRTKLRGWAYAVRAQGWLASWPQWPRWSRMAIGASPRYWTYAAALRVAQQLASGDPGPHAVPEFELPLSSQPLDSLDALRQEIARNYRECVAGTNA